MAAGVREYKLDVIVDDHGAVQKLHEIQAAEDGITQSAQQADKATDGLNKRHSDSLDLTRQLKEQWQGQRQVLQETSHEFDVIKVSASESAEALKGIERVGLRGTLNDIAGAAGLTVEGLGLLNAAGLVVGAGVAGWGLGRAIADLTGLDEKIGHATAALIGWGSVGAESAAAKADVLARATKNVGYEVTNLTEAILINNEAQQKWLKDAQEISNAQQRLRAPAESAREIAGWYADIEKVRASGVLPSLTRDLESHSFSVSELAARYRIAAPAVAQFQKDLQTAAEHHKELLKFSEDAIKRLNDQQKEGEARAKAFETAYTHAMIEGEKHTDALNKKAETLLTTMTNLRVEALKAELAAQTELNAQQGLDAMGQPKATNPLEIAQRGLDDLHKKAQPGVSQAAQEQLIQQQFLRAVSDDTVAIVGKTAAERAAEQQAGSLSRSHGGAVLAAESLSSSFGRASGVFMSSAQSFQQATAQASVQRTLAGFGQFSQGEAAAIAGGQFIAGAGIQKFDVGGPVMKDGPIFAHRDEFVVPKDGALVKSGGGGISVQVDARGAMFEDDLALDRLATKVGAVVAARAGTRF